MAPDEIRDKLIYVVAVLDEKSRRYGMSRMLWQTQWDDVRAELLEIIDALDEAEGE